MTQRGFEIVILAKRVFIFSFKFDKFYFVSIILKEREL